MRRAAWRNISTCAAALVAAVTSGCRTDGGARRGRQRRRGHRGAVDLRHRPHDGGAAGGRQHRAGAPRPAGRSVHRDQRHPLHWSKAEGSEIGDPRRRSARGSDKFPPPAGGTAGSTGDGQVVGASAPAG